MDSMVLVGAGYWDGAPDGVTTRGLYHLSPESGEWSSVTGGLPENVEVRGMAVRGSTLFAGTQFGPCRSTDVGRSWTLMALPGTERVVWSIMPVGEATLYVGTQGTSIYKSDDDGETWRLLSVPTPGGMVRMGFPTRVIRLAHDPNTLLAAFSISADSLRGSLYRSTDLGETWHRFDSGVSIESTLMNIGPSGFNRDRIYCGAREGQIFGTEDGGETWRTLPLPPGVAGVYAVACH